MEEDEPPPPGLEEGKGGDDSCAEDEVKNRHKKVDINDDKEEEDEDSKKEEKSDDDPEDIVSYIDIQSLLCLSLLNYILSIHRMIVGGLVLYDICVGFMFLSPVKSLQTFNLTLYLVVFNSLIRRIRINQRRLLRRIVRWIVGKKLKKVTNQKDSIKRKGAAVKKLLSHDHCTKLHPFF